MNEVEYDSRDLEMMSVAVRYHRWILSRIAPYLGKRVAEVGAGSGSFSELILGEPVEELVAVEPSKNLFPLITAAIGKDPRVTLKRAFFSEVASDYSARFDSVLYINVLEHIEDEAKELEAAHASLKAGGYLCVFVPALPALYSENDRAVGHIRRYTKAYLRKVVRDAGFSVVRLYWFDFFGIAPWFILCTLMGKRPNAGNASLYDALVVPAARAIESIIPPPIGKNLILIARKPV
jgi:SAM-dependent methyltransferase